MKIETKGLVSKVKEMAHMDDPLTSRSSSEFYQMMKEGAATMAANEQKKGGDNKQTKQQQDALSSSPLSSSSVPSPSSPRKQNNNNEDWTSEKEKEQHLRKRFRMPRKNSRANIANWVRCVVLRGGVVVCLDSKNCEINYAHLVAGHSGDGKERDCQQPGETETHHLGGIRGGHGHP